MTSAPAAIASIVRAAAFRSSSPRSVADPSRSIATDVPTGGPRSARISRLVLEPALADDVELGVVAHRALDEPGQRGPLELGQVLAGEVGDEVRGGVDGPPVDAIHALQP